VYLLYWKQSVYALVCPKLTVHRNRENLHTRLIDHMKTAIMIVISSITTLTKLHSQKKGHTVLMIIYIHARSTCAMSAVFTGYNSVQYQLNFSTPYI